MSYQSQNVNAKVEPNLVGLCTTVYLKRLRRYTVQCDSRMA